MARIKNYTKTAYKYAEKLRMRGYGVRFNWVDTVNNYEDITVIGYGEFSTPRKAWEYLTRKGK